MIGVLLGVFAATFLAATVLPLSSEVVVVAAASTELNLIALWATATAGNTLGAIVNWLLGRFALRFQSATWWPASNAQMARAERWFQRYGLYSLLLAWVPLIGDAITVAAGITGIRLVPFTLLVGLGKGLRFGLVVAIAAGLWA